VLNERGGVDILLFPVKLGHWRRLGGGFGLALAVLTAGACGYRSLASTEPADRLCVLAAPGKVPYPSAAGAALDGARAELARHGALRESREYPCLVLEILRVDEVAVGATAQPTASGEQPRARGTDVAVLARGWVLASVEGETSRDTGDVRRSVGVEVTSGVPDSTRHDRAVTAAAHQTGQAIARSALGFPVPADEVP
jgi:hypothetical protein